MRLSPRNLAAAGLVTLLPSLALGGGIPTATQWLEEVVVTGKLERLGGEPTSATVGIATSEQLDLRPVLRTGELLEVVPGLIVTQHSGSGKANQYFLRGFNLDHGTDLATSVDGVPVNMPTHAHGQGYTDINFVIPELIESIEYRKGTYYADTGNFSAAGAVNLRYRSALDAPFVAVESGDDDYLRGLFAASPEIGGGSLLMALEHSDDEWSVAAGGEIPQDQRAAALFARNGRRPLRCDRAGLRRRVALDRPDPAARRAIRRTRSLRLRRPDATAASRIATASQPTGTSSSARAACTRRPMRSTIGSICSRTSRTRSTPRTATSSSSSTTAACTAGSSTWARPLELMGLSHELDVGLEMRRDDIGTVGLYKTVARTRIDTTREDDVTQSSYSAYSSLKTHWSEHVRTEVGLRADLFDFDVRSSLAANSGSAERFDRQPEVLADPRARGSETEFFVNVGKGFHSNDARGTTIRVDPTDGVTPVDRVDPLVDALGRGCRCAHRGAAERAADRVAVDTEARFRAAVRRRCRASPKPAARASGAASRPARSGTRSRG